MGFLPVFSLVIGVGLLSLYACYIVDLEWSHTKLDTLAASQHSNIVSPYSLMIIRAFLAIIIWTTTTYIVLDREGLQLTLERADGSKRTYLLKGLSRLTMFTVWSWILQVRICLFFMKKLIPMTRRVFISPLPSCVPLQCFIEISILSFIDGAKPSFPLSHGCVLRFHFLLLI